MKCFTLGIKFSPKNHTEGECFTDEKLGSMVIQAAQIPGHQQVAEAGMWFHCVSYSSLQRTPTGARKVSTNCAWNLHRPLVGDTSETPSERRSKAIWSHYSADRFCLILTPKHMVLIQLGHQLGQKGCSEKRLLIVSKNSIHPQKAKICHQEQIQKKFQCNGISGYPHTLWRRQMHVYKESRMLKTVLK